MSRTDLIERIGVAMAILMILWPVFVVAVLAYEGFFSVMPISLPSLQGVRSSISSLGILAGVMGGLLALVDWLTPESRKRVIKERLIDVWAWLGDQKAGRFTSVLRLPWAQRLLIALTFLFCAGGIVSYFESRLNLADSLHPWSDPHQAKVFMIEVGINCAALAFSFWLFGRKALPKISAWMVPGYRLGSYFRRLLGVFGITSLLASLSAVAMVWLSSEFMSPHAAASHSIYLALGNETVYLAVHALFAFVCSPLLAAGLMLEMVLFFSLLWVCLVWIAIGIFRCLQLFLERVVSGNPGPVLAISSLLITVSGLVKSMK